VSVRPKSDATKRRSIGVRSNFLEECPHPRPLEHSSIVRVTRVFEANSTAYMVMRFERGRALRTG